MPYVHVVFTLLHRLLPLAYRNSTRLYTWLFQASAATPREVAADPRHVGAEIGVLSILHTWGQTLVRHPHMRCVVPAGGLSRDHRRWVRPKYAGFFLPVKVLSAITAAEPTACSMGPLITRARFLSYLVGEQEIKMLRAYAERELGGGFDIRAFHDEILRNGPLPLNVLNPQIRDWVAARKRDHRGIGDRVVSKKSIGLYSAGPLRG